jgi:hypothetical protein
MAAMFSVMNPRHPIFPSLVSIKNGTLFSFQLCVVRFQSNTFISNAGVRKEFHHTFSIKFAPVNNMLLTENN